jgi:hypothetical protein
LPRLGISSRHPTLKIAAHVKQGSMHHWKFSKVHTDPRFAHGFQPSVCIRLDNKTKKQESYKIMRMIMFAVQDKAKPDIENIRGLNLAAVEIKTVQMAKRPL